MNPPWWAWLSLLAVAVLVTVIWSIRRHREPELDGIPTEPIEDLVPTLSGLTLSAPVAGNAVELLENGRYFEVLLQRIAAAQRSVHFETFLWKEGELGSRLAAALAQRARAGVAVRVLLDANGSRFVSAATRRLMREAGCRVAFFHDGTLHNIGVLNDRDHRKIVVLDGREGFVGGHCIVDSWLGDAEDHRHNADLSVWLRGPAVHSLQAAFSENWAGETGELFGGSPYFPRLAPAGDVVVHAAYAKPYNSAPTVKILHHTAIGLARRRIWIQNPYFIPKPSAIQALAAAVRRGVDVRVLMPSTAGSDNPMVQHAGHRNFGQLLRAGVRLFEYPHTLLHQKAMTVDGAWTAIGSSNFDYRSFETNDEITLGISDPAFAARVDAVFERYVRRAQEIRLEDWEQRPLWHKFKDRVIYSWQQFL